MRVFWLLAGWLVSCTSFAQSASPADTDTTPLRPSSLNTSLAEPAPSSSDSAIRIGSAAAAPRPRIGLALSGGGARGAAHIGVLKALEAHGIPVDCIAGTSMGAVVGGLHASGMSASEIETVFRELDWSRGFRDRPERSKLSFRRKQDDEGYLVNFDLGFRDGDFRLPKGLVQGQNLSLVLREILQHRALSTSFDRLAIPYRAVAADLETGAPVVLDRGVVAEAIHASMAIPGVYQPVERDGRLLVDGGIADNLPVQVVRKMCADIVIAVDVGTPLLNRNEIDSVVDVVDQLSTLLTRRNSDASIATLRSADVLIRPDLSGIAAGDFGQITEALQRGEHAAAGAQTALAAVAQLTGHYAAVSTPAPAQAPRVRSITVNNDSGLGTDNILARLRQPLGQPFDQTVLHEDLEDLYGAGYFGALDYQLQGSQEQAELVLNVPAHPIGPHYFRFGVNLEDNLRGESQFSLGVRHTYMPVNSYGGEWRNELQFGSQTRLFSELFQPTSLDGRWFVGGSLEYARRNILLQQNGRYFSEYQFEGEEARATFGYQMGGDGHALIGARSGTGSLHEHIGTFDVRFDDLDVGEAYFEIGIDKIDHRYFPRKGRGGSLVLSRSVNSLGGDIEYEKWAFDWLQVSSRGRHTFGTQIFAGSFTSDEPPIYEQFQLGGFLRLSGYGKAELAGPHARLLNLFYFARLNNSFSATFDTPVYIGTSAEWGNVWEHQRDISWKSMNFSASVFLGIDTTFGPFYLAYGRNERGGDAVYLFLGSPF